MHKAIDRCRICGEENFDSVIDLGQQALTGVFPQTEDQNVPVGPLELVKCCEKSGGCGLVQLRHSYDPSEMYGDNYGYRSGLNQSMVQHLNRRVQHALSLVSPEAGDVILDIGSNDSTTLQAYGERGFKLLGIDPSAEKFSHHYPSWVQYLPDFFTANNYHSQMGHEKAKIITSISMFYDLEDPTSFMRDIHEVLDDDGVWIFEQSYLPLMIERDAYDTICHEHVSYYALRQIEWMAEKAGLKVLDVELNDINGGSFCVTAAKSSSNHVVHEAKLQQLRDAETNKGYGESAVYDAFRNRAQKHRDELKQLVSELNENGKRICGYGASTKGNVLLQYCGFTRNDIPAIAEVNQDKFGCYTPHTLIPIASEDEVLAMKPDYLLVLPWHFRDNIVVREQNYLNNGGSFVFPLPAIDVVTGEQQRQVA